MYIYVQSCTCTETAAVQGSLHHDYFSWFLSSSLIELHMYMYMYMYIKSAPKVQLIALWKGVAPSVELCCVDLSSFLSECLVY